MARSSRLVDQPNDQFPFNQKTYDRVTPPSPPGSTLLSQLQLF